MKNDKSDRILRIYTKLMNGAVVGKAEESIYFGVNERSIQRDIDDIRDFLESNDDQTMNTVVYDRARRGIGSVRKAQCYLATVRFWLPVKFCWKAVLCAKAKCSPF